jgi:hypothetical protein
VGDSREKKKVVYGYLPLPLAVAGLSRSGLVLCRFLRAGQIPNSKCGCLIWACPGIDAKTTGGNALAPDHWTSMSYPHYRPLGIGWRATAPTSGMKWRRRW